MTRILGLGAMVAALAACGASGATDDLGAEVVANYSAVVHESYLQSLESAQEMDSAIDAFLADPTASTLSAAKGAWLTARVDYGPTEAFRFYGGPIDDDETGVEGLVNAWPLDESYIDYVEGADDAGIVNMVDLYPTIDTGLLLSLNEEGGEANISTGWHAIEFLLWGQDLSADGPGDRPVSDYIEDENAERRAEYLALASDLLLTHLEQMVEAWAPDTENFRAEFEALDPDVALGMVMTGIGELSRGELAGERMTVAYEARSQEDEHSCFSDNTISDIVANASGVARVFHGEFGSAKGPGIYDLIAEADQGLADRLSDEMTTSIENAEAIPVPFDQHLVDGVSDEDPGRVAIMETIIALETQADSIVEAADLLDIEINLT